MRSGTTGKDCFAHGSQKVSNYGRGTRQHWGEWGRPALFAVFFISLDRENRYIILYELKEPPERGKEEFYGWEKEENAFLTGTKRGAIRQKRCDKPTGLRLRWRIVELNLPGGISDPARVESRATVEKGVGKEIRAFLRRHPTRPLRMKPYPRPGPEKKATAGCPRGGK